MNFSNFLIGVKIIKKKSNGGSIIKLAVDVPVKKFDIYTKIYFFMTS